MIEQKHLNLLSVVLLAMFILFRYIEAVTVDVNCRDDADEKTNAAAPLLASQSHILEAGSNALSDLGGPPIFDQFFLLENSHFTPQCTMVPLSTRSCLKLNKLRPILNGQF